jgi:multicomponent Na+:H+ antiporter subunit G
MREWITVILMVLGSSLMLLAAVGVLRMPDLFMRMQAASKASALGAACLLLGVAVYFQDFGVTTRALLVIGFVFLTTPISAHMISRTAYFVGVPLWEHSVQDALKDQYDPRTHVLKSPAEPEETSANRQQAVVAERPAQSSG